MLLARLPAPLRALLLGALPPLAVGFVILAAEAAPRATLEPPTSEANAETLAARKNLLKHELGPEFGIQPVGPFVVASDGSRDDMLKGTKLAGETYRALNALVFGQPRSVVRGNPQPIVDVFLYRERQSYLYHSKLLFHQKPASPHGYYSSKHRAISVDLSTGDGINTLRHEISHPLVQADFPACPTWFDEALAAYVEQATVEQGVLRELPDSSLSRKLRVGMRNGEVPTLAAFTAIGKDQFYYYRFGYVHGQHLVAWLRSREQLGEFYQSFRREVAGDSTGYRTLQRVTDLSESELEAEFTKFVSHRAAQ